MAEWTSVIRMRVAIRFKTAAARAQGSFLLADQPGGVDCLPGGIYLTNPENLRLLNGRNGRRKYAYNIVDSSEVNRAIDPFMARGDLPRNPLEDSCSNTNVR